MVGRVRDTQAITGIRPHKTGKIHAQYFNSEVVAAAAAAAVVVVGGGGLAKLAKLNNNASLARP
jgi:hypothetical protein